MAHILSVKFSYQNIRGLPDNQRDKKTFVVCSDLLIGKLLSG